MHRDSLPARRRYVQLVGSADALALARLARSDAAPLAVICASAQDAQRLVEEIRWFAPGLRVCLLPDWETLPYDQFSPHPDLVSERLTQHGRIVNQRMEDGRLLLEAGAPSPGAEVMLTAMHAENALLEADDNRPARQRVV